jgi:MFS family permease
MSSTLRVLRDRNGAAYLCAVVVSGFGTSAMMLAAGIWTMTLTHSTSLAALVTFVVWAPTLAGPLIGALVDRVRQRRLVLVVSNLTMAGLLLTLFTVSSAREVWWLFVVMLIYGVSFVALDSAETAMLPATISPELLADVNGLRMSASEGMKLLAPLVGAGLFAYLGGHSVALLDAATFLVAAYLCSLLRPRHALATPSPNEASGWLRRSADGIRHMVANAALRRIVFSGSATMFIGGVSGAAIFAVVTEGLHRAPAFVGVVTAVQGAGSVLGGFLAGPLLNRVATHVFVSASVALFAVSIFLRATPWLPTVLAAALVAGISLPWTLIAIATTVQRDTDPAYLGRVAGTVHLLTFAPNAVGQGICAGLLAFADYRLILVALGVAGLFTALWCRWRFPAPLAAVEPTLDLNPIVPGAQSTQAGEEPG